MMWKRQKRFLIVQDSKSKKVRFSAALFEYPLALDLKTNGEQNCINDTFAQGGVCNKGQKMIKYLMFVDKEVIQGTEQAGDDSPH